MYDKKDMAHASDVADMEAMSDMTDLPDMWYKGAMADNTCVRSCSIV